MVEQPLNELLNNYVTKVEPYIDSCIAKHQLEQANHNSPSNEIDDSSIDDPLLHQPRIVAALSAADAERALLKCLQSLQPHVEDHAQWLHSLRHLHQFKGSKQTNWNYQHVTLSLSPKRSMSTQSHKQQQSQNDASLYASESASFRLSPHQYSNVEISSAQRNNKNVLNSTHHSMLSLSGAADDSLLPSQTQASMEYLVPSTAELQQQQQQEINRKQSLQQKSYRSPIASASSAIRRTSTSTSSRHSVQRSQRRTTPQQQRYTMPTVESCNKQSVKSMSKNSSPYCHQQSISKKKQQQQSQKQHNHHVSNDASFHFTGQSELSPIQQIPNESQSLVQTQQQSQSIMELNPLTQSQQESKQKLSIQKQEWTAASIARQLCFELQQLSLHESQQQQQQFTSR
jgi:hypothetical protein